MADAATWRPGADLRALQARARLHAGIRAFFAERGVMEVQTPLLGSFPVTEPAIESIAAGERWLQTSPEYAMKRLLAAGSGPIYQIAHAFRAGEAGRRHNPEFTLLEWYRPGFDHRALMDEVAALVAAVAGVQSTRRVTFAELILDTFGVDPLGEDTATLAAAVQARAARDGRELDVTRVTDGERVAVLDLAYAEAVDDEPTGALFVHDFPPEQAALARLRDTPRGPVAERFELVIDGVEIANGFHELADADEQRRRFERDRQRRREAGQAVHAVDERLLAALAEGLPDCAGVAMGLERLLMRELGATRIDEVLAFSWDRS